MLGMGAEKADLAKAAFAEDTQASVLRPGSSATKTDWSKWFTELEKEKHERRRGRRGGWRGYFQVLVAGGKEEEEGKARG